jgi:hypothetical protein
MFAGRDLRAQDGFADRTRRRTAIRTRGWRFWVRPAADPIDAATAASPGCREDKPDDDGRVGNVENAPVEEGVFQWRGGRPDAFLAAVHGAAIVNRQGAGAP